MSFARFVTSAAALLLSTGCSVKLLGEQSTPSAVNRCDTDADCGSGATCVQNACFSAIGTIDEVVLSIGRDSSTSGTPNLVASSPFLSPQSGVAAGDRARAVQLPNLSAFAGVVQIGAASPCQGDGRADSSGAYSIAAHVEFARTGNLGGVPILGIPYDTTSFDTSSSNYSFGASLVPGTYDVYVEPVCADIAPLLISGLDIGETVDLKAVPAILALPEAKTMTGQVERRDLAPSATLDGWTMSLIDAQNGRRVSTIGTLGATDVGDQTTSPKLSYQPVMLASQTGNAAADSTSPTSLLIQIAPPANLVAPTVYWDLSAANLDASGALALDMTGLPTPDQLVRVDGTVRGGSKGVPAVLYFFTSQLEQSPTAQLAQSAGLIANFSSPQVPTDSAGRYEVMLYPGHYRIVTAPVAAAASPGGPSPWATTEETWIATGKGPLAHDVALGNKVALTGTAVLSSGEPAAGSSVEASASLDPTLVNTLRSALAKGPTLPASQNAQVADDGTFSLAVDPGKFDATVQPPDGSNLAFWIYPALPISTSPVTLSPVLGPPVAFEGQVLDAKGEPAGRLLITAYAKAPSAAVVTKVAFGRTDDAGNFKLRIPAAFGP
jgi:hypothetical protein